MAVSSDRLLASRTSASRVARGYVDELGDRLEPSLLADVRLLVSELVSNGVKYGPNLDGEVIRLQLSVSDEQVRAEVHDGGHCFDPSAAAPANSDSAGLGLRFVEQVADRWGVDCRGSTSVWFELDLEPRVGDTLAPADRRSS
jgi:anti-sigma regulatory factor (Ser/Thr protein kinase)